MLAAYNGADKPLYISSKEEIVQRASMILTNVEYVIEAHFEMTEKANETDNPGNFKGYYDETSEKRRVLSYAIFWMQRISGKFCTV